MGEANVCECAIHNPDRDRNRGPQAEKGHYLCSPCRSTLRCVQASTAEDQDTDEE